MVFVNRYGGLCRNARLAELVRGYVVIEQLKMLGKRYDALFLVQTHSWRVGDVTLIC